MGCEHFPLIDTLVMPDGKPMPDTAKAHYCTLCAEDAPYRDIYRRDMEHFAAHGVMRPNQETVSVNVSDPVATAVTMGAPETRLEILECDYRGHATYKDNEQSCECKRRHRCHMGQGPPDHPNDPDPDDCMQCLYRPLEEQPLLEPYLKTPGLREKMANLSSAIWKWGKSGFGLAPKEVQDERLAICGGCKFLMANRTCAKCGCFVDTKVRLPTESCPINKWLPYEKTQDPKV